VQSGAAWLTVDPTEGESTGPGDAQTITIAYPGIAGHPCGTYQGQITVSDPSAINDPQILTVTVHVQSVKPDFDCDGDVDQSDFGVFQACLTGSGVPQQNPACFAARLECSDTDVDAGDFVLFQECISGPNIPADPNCIPTCP
jgi:hypothetical protein